ncbi:hypothetical protein [Variovorax soli]|uniref:hypothetical protein n=1 Tax=Variovorax soli TaxID=376815 RepID=UPI0008396FCA|nr:hypothetical protein [Variovorax soli]
MKLDEIIARPELLLGPNPLLEALPPFVQHHEWAQHMESSPLADVDWRRIPPGARDALTNMAISHYVPVRTVFSIASGLQKLVRRAYIATNPLNAAERRRRNAVVLSDSLQAMNAVANVEAGGAIIKAMTGMGKSRLVSRTLGIIAPQPVIHHSACAAAGWAKLSQIVYLNVQYSPNGSRGGLLHAILFEVDKALGGQSEYFDQHRKRTNIDVLMVKVAQILVNHRVALVVIDEKQGQNFADSPWSLQFVIFYLILMNLGISIVMVGNPLAFVHLEAFSQVRRRFSVGGIDELLPAQNPSVDWWAEDFVPHVRRFSLVEKEMQMTPMRAQREFELTGGNPSFYFSLWTLAQQEALRNAAVHGRSSANLTVHDLERAAKSPQYLKVQEDAQVFGQGEAALRAGRRLLDVPPSTRRNKADSKTPLPDAGTSPLSSDLPDPSPAQAVQKLLRTFEANFKRIKNDTLARAKALQELKPEQREMLGLQHELIDNAQQALSAGSSSRRGRR